NCARASDVGFESQTVQLEDFARTLVRDRVVAVRVSADEADIEGVLWFAILEDLPIKLTEATMHAGQEFGEGWLVAHGHWFSWQGTPAANGDRTYVILPAVVMLNVNSMLRVITTPIVFNAANKNARPRRARGGGFTSGTTYLLSDSGSVGFGDGADDALALAAGFGGFDDGADDALALAAGFGVFLSESTCGFCTCEWCCCVDLRVEHGLLEPELFCAAFQHQIGQRGIR
ncbi:hypothetical protein T492DRAFT_890993, partial [Pavlovales sp. CCMP2436]